MNGTNRLSQGQRLLAIFVLTVFLPGLLLAIFGARALWQEKQSVSRQLIDHVERAAEATSRVLTDELDKLQSMVDSGLPAEKSFQSLPADGTWAYAARDVAKILVYPANALPYELNEPPIVPTADPEIAKVETLEAQDKTLAADLVAIYHELLMRATPDVMPRIKHDLARSLRKAGNLAEAQRLWSEIETEGGQISSLPADLVAGFELALSDNNAAREFLRHLETGRWRIEKTRYLSYLGEICERLKLSQESSKGLRLAIAVEKALHSPKGGLLTIENTPFIVFRSKSADGTLVIAPEFLKLHVWPRVTEAATPDGSVFLINVEDTSLYRMTLSSTVPATRTFTSDGLSWKVGVDAKNAAGFYAAANRKIDIYIAMLLLIVALIVSGGYFTSRTVSRELEVARMKSDFVSTVSHEFRSPLTGIRQLREMLARDRIADEHKRHQYYDLIVRESERLARLVENVLDFSRMEEGRKQYRFEKLDTANWLIGVAADFQIEASRSEHVLETDIPEGLPMVSGDREALSTAVHNLLDNACKYSPNSKTVWLEAEACNGGIAVAVRDHGFGIPEREQRQIFEKFYRVDGDLSRRVKGAGLGLSLVQHIVTAHQGEVRVNSREGEGSTFTIHLGASS